MRYLFILSLFIVSCSQPIDGTTPGDTPPISTPPVVNPPTKDFCESLSYESTCPAKGVYQAVDAATPVSQKYLDTVKCLGVKTVYRYYDHTNETIRGKTLKQAEVDLLRKNGMGIGVVFQHNNNNIASFTAARGTSDANRSLELAAGLKQPKGSSISFGVDGSWNKSAEITAIKSYFKKAGPIIRGAGYRIGAYGSGLTCRYLLDEKLVDQCWLANATGWPEYQKFKDTNRWTMVQSLPKTCGGMKTDFNVVSKTVPAGHW